MKSDGIEYVKPNYKGKKAEKKVMDAAEKGELTAYIKHPVTGLMIPVGKSLVIRLRAGEQITIAEIEAYNQPD